MNFIKKINKDLICVTALIIITLALASVFWGYAGNGINSPMIYEGGDDVTTVACTKLITETGWFWVNENIGAPFNADHFDFSADLLLNFDLFLAWIISWFVKDAVTAVNIRFLLVFPMCGASAYYCLRELKIKRPISMAGSVIFAFAPYIVYRKLVHFSLSTCYFVPLSILLCVWAYRDDEDYLKFNKSFFKNKKNVLTILFAAFIANNGIGYYAIFTCFFLCVCALCRLVSEKRLRSVLPAVKTIGAIFIFFMIALIPYFVNIINNGYNADAVIRSPVGSEVYGLKIAQLFVPTNGHGIPFLERLIYGYNTKMPLVNENIGSYLGLAGMLGFVISLIIIAKKSDHEEKTDLFVLSRMNVFAVLLAVIGGFSVLVSLVFPFIRGYNRISVFIMFISLAVFCKCAQNLLDSEALKKRKGLKIAVIVLLSAYFAAALFDQLPVLGARDSAFKYNKALYLADEEFVNGIEDTLGENAMVYQLPYHQTPEGGGVYGMADYQHYTGYIHSKTLKWSYGGTKGRKSDIWNKNVSSLPVPDMITVIAKAGFTGIYIDSRAYPGDKFSELCESIEDVLGYGVCSSNSNGLYFYDMREYISRNNIAKDDSVLSEYLNG